MLQLVSEFVPNAMLVTQSDAIGNNSVMAQRKCCDTLAASLDGVTNND
jgi:hypothetical protein